MIDVQMLKWKNKMFGNISKHHPSLNTIASASLLLLQKVAEGRMRLRTRLGMRPQPILKLLAFSLLFTSCHNLSNLNKTQTFTFDLQGHRGCRGLMPENTIPAMLKAIDVGVTTLEMDVCISKDSQVIVSHEPFFNHEITTKPDGSFVTEAEEKSLNIYRMDYTEIIRYDVGLKPHPRFPQQQKIAAVKPKLADLLDAVDAYCITNKKKLVRFNIEIKSLPIGDRTYHPLPGPLAEMVVAVITEKKMENRVIIQSFDMRPLQYLHQQYPAITTALLVEEGDKKSYALQLQQLGFIPTIYSPHYELVTPLLVKQCKDMNVRLIPWTVNDPAKFEELKAMGVNGIITDYPPDGKHN